MNEYLWVATSGLIDLLRYLLCINVVLGISIKNKKLIPVWIACSVGLCLLCYRFFNYHNIYMIMPNMCMLFLLFLMDKDKKTSVRFLSVMVSWVIMDVCTGLIGQIVSIIDGNYSNFGGVASIRLLIVTVVEFLLLFLYHFIVNVAVRKKYDFSLYPWQMVTVVIFGIGIILIVIPIDAIISGKKLSNEIFMVMGISFTVILFIFVAIMFWHSYVMKKNEDLKRRESSYRYMLESQSRHFEELLKNYNELRKIRHDMRGHIVALREYAGEKADDKMMEYLNDMEEKTNALGAHKYIGNRAVDAVINDQVHQMKDMGIEFDFDGFCNIREDIKEFDLCTIFYNLIRNAVEACEKVDSKEKIICVKVKNIGDKLGIAIENNTILKEIPSTGILVTTKKDKMNHGLGTLSVRDTVARYEGVYVNNIENGRFIANVVI